MARRERKRRKRKTKENEMGLQTVDWNSTKNVSKAYKISPQLFSTSKTVGRQNSLNPLEPFTPSVRRDFFFFFFKNFADPRNLRPASEYGLPYTQTSYF